MKIKTILTYILQAILVLMACAALGVFVALLVVWT